MSVRCLKSGYIINVLHKIVCKLDISDGGRGGGVDGSGGDRYLGLTHQKFGLIADGKRNIFLLL